MATDRITIVEIDALNPYEVAVSFSDRTTGVITVEQLLTLLPKRIDSGSDNVGT